MASQAAAAASQAARSGCPWRGPPRRRRRPRAPAPPGPAAPAPPQLARASCTPDVAVATRRRPRSAQAHIAVASSGHRYARVAAGMPGTVPATATAPSRSPARAGAGCPAGQREHPMRLGHQRRAASRAPPPTAPLSPAHPGRPRSARGRPAGTSARTARGSSARPSSMTSTASSQRPAEVSDSARFPATGASRTGTGQAAWPGRDPPARPGSRPRARRGLQRAVISVPGSTSCRPEPIRRAAPRPPRQVRDDVTAVPAQLGQPDLRLDPVFLVAEPRRQRLQLLGERPGLLVPVPQPQVPDELGRGPGPAPG